MTDASSRDDFKNPFRSNAEVRSTRYKRKKDDSWELSALEARP